MINPYALLDVLTDEEAARAITDLVVVTTRQEAAQVKLIKQQLARDIAAGKLPATVTEVQGYRRLGMRRIRMDDDTDQRPLVPSHQERTTRIARDALLTWCEQQGIRPALLFPEPIPAEKPLHANERRTLLATIRALAELHGINPASGAYRKEAEALLAELASKGISPPCNEKTLSKHLAAAFESR